MPKFLVPLVRETTEYEWATVEVEAADEEAAIEKAINIGQGFSPDDDSSGFDYGAACEQVEWNDHGCGFGQPQQPRRHPEDRPHLITPQKVTMR